MKKPKDIIQNVIFFHRTPQIIMISEITRRVKIENVLNSYILEF